ncbi:phosphate ABC transporter, permease protein PstA [Candidatus Gottesmanbacteria bacterium CG11_big_fil_rev_8_21_14_0_20_37_11]|uniref:Phosphate transport system permease protein PstA n=3 Tax=Candidatus Gottesmaniibacteriota TaxID=1752720 RepID=A0A2M7RSU6_9BACT|nr:MAG: phosphate ABC transporter, permease protein PstA [Candidatus Gottesmanbacteria bacterium CG1_02_37_22]PIP33315.1 MAG: phosphate ABC transporter, permease protein PstA [Candidatus Gottesmanbacteria bacterium CG23_combo_of_CG06-09_8_20_14_all_37_19]PIR08821.1 MAG: phosphate ABC transporter, permease protein PstA [Candidatus Gottesmanbacteria bacterium CG11_big_fil_rev_8_21_14_0_20_37_11]PIZ03326.1 MAG: phosphate ABC transporter, permease protein PstA [Candidatus Gottesmanbacteria bacterium
MNPKLSQIIAKICLGLAMLFTISILIFIIIYILFHGLPILTYQFLSSPIQEMGKKGGIFPSIVSTLYLVITSVVVATPLGVGTAVYITEYTKKNKITDIIQFGSDCLAGIPSIIYGLFGFTFFVIFLGMGWSILSGSLTLAIMMLPTIIRTSEQAIRSVPQSYRDVTYSLGGSKWQGIKNIVIPKALPGILTGVILSMGRALSETAALIFTAGMSIRTPTSIFSSGRSMAVHFYTLAREGLSLPMAYGTASVLIISILFINFISYILMNQYLKKYS